MTKFSYGRKFGIGAYNVLADYIISLADLFLYIAVKAGYHTRNLTGCQKRSK